MTPITYVSDQPGDYAKALRSADTLEALRAVTEAWRELAEDAAKVAQAMTEEDFQAWCKGYAKEQLGEFAGVAFAKKYGDLMLPTKMFKVSVMAVNYKVPWGLMYLRLKETGNLEKALASNFFDK